jgi:glucose/arabinose dehydrogenase
VGVSVALVALLGALATYGGSGAPPAGAAATTTTTTVAPPNLSQVSVKLATFATGLSEPVAMVWRPQDPRIFVVEQTGKIRILDGSGHILGTLVDLSNLISTGNEEGVLGAAFSRDGTKLYVDSTDPNFNIRITEFTMANNAIKPGSARRVLVIPHPVNQNHNGGQLIIGRDNMLYIGVGDGGGGGDVPGNAQNRGVLLGKILRIDPRPLGSQAYRIPPDNPFVGVSGARPEIWMYGLRNPWRFTFDSLTNDMWIGDVGQALYEEVDYAPAGMKGTNWGWNLREGLHPYNGGAKPPGAVDPILERAHTLGDCAIVGGYVYRATSIPHLTGAYLFSDFCTGKMMAVVRTGNTITQNRELGPVVDSMTSFAQGPLGGLYELSRGGTIYRLNAG